MTSHQKKTVKKVQPNNKKSNPQQEIDEGILDRLLGRSSMTPQQEAVLKQFTANFVGNAVGAIDREIKAGKINPKATATSTAPAAPAAPATPATSTAPRTGRTVPTPSTTTIPSPAPVTESQIRYQKLNMLFEGILAEQTQMSISQYLDTVYLPFYLKKRKIPDDTLPAVKQLTKQVETDWTKTLGGKGKKALEQLAGVVYNMIYLGTLDSDDAKPAAAGIQQTGNQPAAPSSAQQTPGGAQQKASSNYRQTKQTIDQAWEKLNKQERNYIKNYIAKKV